MGGFKKGLKSVWNGVKAPLDRRGPHQFDAQNRCIYCQGTKQQLGNLYNCSNNPKWWLRPWKDHIDLHRHINQLFSFLYLFFNNHLLYFFQTANNTFLQIYTFFIKAILFSGLLAKKRGLWSKETILTTFWYHFTNAKAQGSWLNMPKGDAWK